MKVDWHNVLLLIALCSGIGFISAFCGLPDWFVALSCFLLGLSTPIVKPQ